MKGIKIGNLAKVTAISLLLTTLFSCQHSVTHLSTENKVADNEYVTVKPELNFSITEGNTYNHFYRAENVAAHSLFTSGTSPRVVVAFPAGNSAVSLWFAENEQPITWSQIGATNTLHQSTPDGEPLNGLSMSYQTNATNLVIDQAILGSVRVVRDFAHVHNVPSVIVNQQSIVGNNITWYRDRLDGNGGYRLSVTVNNGFITKEHNQKVHFSALPNKTLSFNIEALTGDMPLTPIKKDNLLKSASKDQALMTNVLSYLSYEEKMLAGSWRFQTYFGRDTLLSLAMLMPNLTDHAVEAGLSSTIERLADTGEVAHEEDIGEFAVLRHMREQKSTQKNTPINADPIFDYKMKDDNFMLSIIVAKYLLEHSNDVDTAKAFLARSTADGKTYAELLVKNFSYVMKTAQPFIDHPSVDNLIHLNDGEHFGEWRDSHVGLGYGRIPYNVSAVFGPAALQSIADLYQSGLFDHALDDGFDDVHDANLGVNLNINLGVKLDVNTILSNAKVWQQSASFFKVSLTAEESAKRRTTYLAHREMTSLDTPISKQATEKSFYAVSLSESGKPVEILNSDFGFALLFTKPAIEQLEFAIDSVIAPYPEGLLSPVGLMVASPVYAKESLYSHVTNNHYHGEVVWSWQQALFAAGLEKQLQRSDLPLALKTKLEDAKIKLWQVIDSTQALKQAELWTWAFEDNEFSIQPFGQQSADKTESNAAQLWSTVYLGIGK